MDDRTILRVRSSPGHVMLRAAQSLRSWVWWSTSALVSRSLTKVMWLSRVLGAMRVRAAGRLRSLVNTLWAETSWSLESSSASNLAPVCFTAPDKMRCAYSCKPSGQRAVVNSSGQQNDGLTGTHVSGISCRTCIIRLIAARSDCVPVQITCAPTSIFLEQSRCSKSVQCLPLWP